MQHLIRVRSSIEKGNGAEMHDNIPADRWCVTKMDLKRLCRAVSRAIKTGDIRPTELDAFDPQDTVYGPTIYTVNEQFIKPRTARVGNMSWALMKHPSGLRCDLFVTHAWQEGIFEFVGKVLNSWPPRAKHAWCCMLANPQNLDISHLLMTPSSSPFALALQSATYMLVVPNRHASIYTRLWCSYEAYLAYELDKIIVTASARPAGRVLAMLIAVLCAVVGGAVGYAQGGWGGKFIFNVFGFTVYPLLLGSVLSSNYTFRRFCNLLGAFWCSEYYMMVHNLSPEMLGWAALHSDNEWGHWREMCANSTLALVIYFCSAEIDRMRSMANMHEADMLKKKLHRVHLWCDCTSADDAAKIRTEIAGVVPEVDRAVDQLIHAGMSTRNLRSAAESGVDVERFASVGYSFGYLMAMSSVPTPSSLGVTSKYLLVLALFNMVLGAT